MTITAKQLADRKKGIGSSDAAAILGYDPYKSPHDVWREKMGLQPPFEGNEATDFGNKAEGMLREYASDYVGMPVAAPKGVFVRGILRANVDGQVDKYGKGNPIVECKTTRITDGWGEPGTDQIPDKVNIQVHHQMLCAESDFAYVVMLTKYLDVKVYEVPFNGDIARSIEEQCNAWWHLHIVKGIEPDITPATNNTKDYFNSLQYENTIESMIDDRLIQTLEDAKAAEKAAKQRVADAKAVIMQKMGNAAKGLGNGRFISISNCSGRVSFDRKRFAIEHPELVERYTSVGNPYTMMKTNIIKDKD